MIPLPIDKQYLISSLKDFDEKILSKKYANGSATDKPGTSEISKSDGNAIKENEDGLYVTDLAPDVQKNTGNIADVMGKVDAIKKYQKYLNTELEWGVLGTDHEAFTSTNTGLKYIIPKKGESIPFNVFRRGNAEFNPDTYAFKLKKSKAYRLYAEVYEMSARDNSKNQLMSTFGFKNLTTGEILHAAACTMYADGRFSVECLYKPDDDCEIAVIVIAVTTQGNAGYVVNTEFPSTPYTEECLEHTPLFSVFEIGRAIEIDPVNYVNEHEGIEDVSVGAIISIMGNEAPKHYLKCDGSEYNIDQYPYLAEYFKEQFGTYNHFGGDGVVTFAIPDLRGEFLRGTGLNSHINDAGITEGNGAEVGIHQNASAVQNIYVGKSSKQVVVMYEEGGQAMTNEDTSYSIATAGIIQSSTADSSFAGYTNLYTTRPTNTSILWCIKAEPTYYFQINGEGLSGVKDIDEIIENLNEKNYLKGLVTEEKVREDIDAHTEAMKEEIRNGYQKILDEDIGYLLVCRRTGNTYEAGTDLVFTETIDTNKSFSLGNGKIKLDEDGYIILKKDKLYSLFPNVMIGDTAGKDIPYNLCVKGEGFNELFFAEIGKYSDAMYPLYFKPKNDCAISIRLSLKANVYQYSMSVLELKQPVYTNVTVASYADQVGHGEDTPVGQIISFMGTKAPENYLACDGAEYNIGDYPDLEEFLVEQFGSVNHFGGDGTTTFAVPDLRGEFLRGTGMNSHEGNGNGADVGEHQDATKENYSSKDPSNDSTYLNFFGTNGDEYASFSQESMDTYTKSDDCRYVNMPKQTTHEGIDYYTSRPTNTSVMYCIKCVRTFSMKLDEAKIYSEEERVIGKWIDGKVLYQKVIRTGFVDIGGAVGNYIIPIDVDNMDFGYITMGLLINESDTYKTTISIPSIDGGIYAYMDRLKKNIVISINNTIPNPNIVCYEFVINYAKK